MKRRDVKPDQIKINPFTIIDRDWFLLTAGDFSKQEYNCMTIGWGSLGTMWKKPLVMVVVRPTRYTFSFMEKHPTFTVSAFPNTCQEKLQYLGTTSGRNEDKIKKSELTPEASKKIAAPSFKEASLVLECKKIYWSDFDPKHFLADYIQELYDNDYHRMYFGEVLAAQATDDYLS